MSAEAYLFGGLLFISIVVNIQMISLVRWTHNKLQSERKEHEREIALLKMGRALNE